MVCEQPMVVKWLDFAGPSVELITHNFVRNSKFMEKQNLQFTRNLNTKVSLNMNDSHVIKHN